VIDAPQIANATGRRDKVVTISTATGRVTLRETEGRSRGNVVHYVSTDASKAGPAALEGATPRAPSRYGADPRRGRDRLSTGEPGCVHERADRRGQPAAPRHRLSSRRRTGPAERLGVGATAGRYSPLWDVHLTEWTAAAQAAGRNLRQSRFADVEDLARAGLVTAPGGGAWGPSDVVVICPIVSQG
jgi:hypothetical protein